jgi:hypothetical protein
MYFENTHLTFTSLFVFHPLPPASAEVNAWSYTSTPQYVFMAWCLVKHRDNFTFTFTFFSLLPSFLSLWFFLFVYLPYLFLPVSVSLLLSTLVSDSHPVALIRQYECHTVDSHLCFSRPSWLPCRVFYFANQCCTIAASRWNEEP